MTRLGGGGDNRESPLGWKKGGETRFILRGRKEKREKKTEVRVVFASWQGKMLRSNKGHTNTVKLSQNRPNAYTSVVNVTFLKLAPASHTVTI